MTQLEDRDYSVAEVAAIFECHIETVKMWLRGQTQQKMEGRKIGGKWRISHTEIERFANLKYGS